MAIEEIAGAGAGGGILGAVLTFFGIKQRIDRQDKVIDDMSAGTVWRPTCAATHEAVNHRLDSIERKIDLLIEKVQ